MDPTTLEEFYADPALRRRLFQAAHRERARAVRAGLARLASLLAPRRAPTRWLARLG